MTTRIHRTLASIFFPAVILGSTAVSAAATDVPDALRERSSPAGAASPVSPGDSLTAEERQRLARRDRQEMDRPAAAGRSSPGSAPSDRASTQRREVPTYVDGAPAPWSASPY